MSTLKCTHRSILVIIVTFLSVSLSAQQANNKDFNKMIDQYYEDGIIFNPLGATQRGDNRFNDLLPNNIAVPYLQEYHG